MTGKLTMEALRKDLPAGIKANWVNGKLHFTVRSSRKGKKVSLGTYLSLDLAINALVQFKTRGFVSITTQTLNAIASNEAHRQARLQVDMAEKQASMLPKSACFEILRDVAPHLLDSNKPYFHSVPATNESPAKIVTIPAEIVAEFFHALFELNDAPIHECMDLATAQGDMLPGDSVIMDREAIPENNNYLIMQQQVADLEYYAAQNIPTIEEILAAEQADRLAGVPAVSLASSSTGTPDSFAAIAAKMKQELAREEQEAQQEAARPKHLRKVHIEY